MDIDSSNPLEPLIPKPWKLSDLKNVVEKWQTFKRDEGFWNTYVTLPPRIQIDWLPEADLWARPHRHRVFIENHDQSRVVSRFGNDSEQWRSYSAKLFALLEISQGGTLFIYQGQELGLKNFPASWGLEEYKDAATINFWNRSVGQRHTLLPFVYFPMESCELYLTLSTLVLESRSGERLMQNREKKST